MRGDRLISILLMLQAQGQMTAKELAERLEVSERTIYRDMEALSGAGIPVMAERGINGGWSLLDDYQTTLTGLKESEIRALFVPLSEQLLDDLGLTRISEEARNKLIASLPSVYRQNAKDVWNRIYIDTRAWRHKKEKAASFEVLKDAIWKDQKLKIVYQRADGQTADRIVAPLGLVAKGSNWYLIASKENGEIRNYRASRIHSATPVRETFERPENFDIAHVWQSSTKEFIERLPTYEVRVKAAQDILPRLSFTNYFVRIIETNEVDQEGWIPVTLSFDTEEEAKRYILGFAEHIRIIEPKELHGKILNMAESIVAHYKS
ncbi:YafY family protein [Bacillus paralicheniformis]|uniref:helix-turn-helix transcriptional regulator n=1 Tax=Bacillus TaxID=1386 RepID=UPI00189B4E37|nr:MULTISPECIES: YafY family protein [Bacillus]MCD2369470.1 YafY family transcriptional regulator [Bacillus sp. BS3(2021)]MCJ8230863.1 YafY family transcriptional regulator [Bacillus paralicheniformis]MEB3129895.1 YafY family protein [Bacillus paralicheniformis]MED1149272.1 YafY family protein [Bacillus paralicheniformis]